MSSYSITEPSARQKWVSAILVIGYALITITPLVWIIATGLKSADDSIAYPPKVLFTPSLEGYVNNVFNDTNYTSAIDTTMFDPTAAFNTRANAALFVNLPDQRTAGVQVKVKF